MILDSDTNIVFLADTLPVRHPEFFARFTSILNQSCITYALIPGTKDIWAVDYMPIQVSKEKFVQFSYNPDYLRNSKWWRETIPDVDAICSKMGITTVKSDIVLDGGNVIRWRDKVIMTEKVFKENPHFTQDNLTTELKALFEVDKIIFIPQQPYDYIGHADGMIRFVACDTILVNDYSRESRAFQRRLLKPFKEVGLSIIEVPYNPYTNTNDLSAVGTYVNYLEVGNAIVVPQFYMAEDKMALTVLEQAFNGRIVIPCESKEIALDGGVLNCISWNIAVS